MSISLPPVPATNPAVIPAVPQQTFINWQMTLLQINAIDAAHSKYSAQANFLPSYPNADGSVTLAPQGSQVSIGVPDLYQQAASDTTAVPTTDASGNPVQITLAGLMAGIVEYLTSLGHRNGQL